MDLYTTLPFRHDMDNRKTGWETGWRDRFQHSEKNVMSHYPRAINLLNPVFRASYFFLAYFSISVFDCTDYPCFEVKRWRGLTVREYKTSRGKRQSKWLWNLWKRRMTPAPDNQMHHTASLTTWRYTKNYMYTVAKNLQKKRHSLTLVYKPQENRKF